MAKTLAIAQTIIYLCNVNIVGRAALAING